jgi:ribosome-binding protein aMBF1 (putative translation factor)
MINPDRLAWRNGCKKCPHHINGDGFTLRVRQSENWVCLKCNDPKKYEHVDLNELFKNAITWTRPETELQRMRREHRAERRRLQAERTNRTLAEIRSEATVSHYEWVQNNIDHVRAYQKAYHAARRIRLKAEGKL